MRTNVIATSITKRRLVAAAGIAMLAVPLAACGGSDTSGAPQPIARVDSLTGDTTAIALDKGFTDALTSLSVAPGVVGTAEIGGQLGGVPDHRRQRPRLQEG